MIADASFSFLFSKTPGEAGSKLILGGVNPAYATEDMKYVDLISETYW